MPPEVTATSEQEDAALNRENHPKNLKEEHNQHHINWEHIGIFLVLGVMNRKFESRGVVVDVHNLVLSQSFS